MSQEKVILKALKITKDFPGTRALDNVSLDLKSGEIHALVGENGAGKSTLIKILNGIISEYDGDVIVNGSQVKINNPRKAYELGIAVVSQELDLVPTLSVEQNLFLAHEPLRFDILIKKKKISEESKKIIEYVGVNAGRDTLLEDLSLGQQQMVAIARALTFNPGILFLDEPTSSLASAEIERLFAILKELRNTGVSIVYVSHRLEEIFQLADRVTVLRDGRAVDTKDIKEVTSDSLITMMVGRKISEMYPKEIVPVKEEALLVKNLSKKGVCTKIDLSVRKGEVAGLYGLVGAGRTELARIIFGLDSYDEGEIVLFGKKINKLSPGNSINSGLGFLTEDRNNEGLCMNLSVKRNITRASMHKLFPKGFINLKKEEMISKEYFHKLNIKAPSINRSVTFLSGGNRQKVVFAHWLCVGSGIMILDEPTRGIDVGAKVEIYKIINKLAKDGTAILFISSDLPEIMGISDKIYAMYKGEITGCFAGGQKASSEEIISCAIGR